MPTPVRDDDGDARWGWFTVPGFVPKTIRQALAEPFDPEAEFYIHRGIPYVVYGDWDYCESWATYPPRDVICFIGILSGTKVTEAQFRQLVRAMHAIGAKGSPCG
jgi:hypothetical protein